MKLFILLLSLTITYVHSASINDPMELPTYAKLKLKRAKQSLIKKPVIVKKKVEKEKLILNLQSILFSKNRKVATINNKSLVVGDRIEGARIISIKKDGVRLVKKRKVVNLKLKTYESTFKITKTKQAQ